MEVFGVYGADAMRYFLVTSPVVNGLEVRVADSEFREIVKSVLLPLWNVYSFLCSYANLDGYKPKLVASLTRYSMCWIAIYSLNTSRF